MNKPFYFLIKSKNPLFQTGFALLCFAALSFFVSFIDFTLASLAKVFHIPLEKIFSPHHFSWHLGDLLSFRGVTLFLEKITEHKTGVLGEQWFYLLLLAIFFISLFVLLLSFFFSNPVGIVGKEGGKIVTSSSLNHLLLRLLFWLVIKQLIFVFFIPPWQAPDETLHYMYTGYVTNKDDVDLNSKARKSTEKFEFKKHAEVDRIPHVWNWSTWYLTSRHQPHLYYEVTSAFLRVAKVDTLPDILYVGRSVSSFCLVVTFGIVYLIFLNVFPPSSFRPSLLVAGLTLLASLPQLSFIGATMGGDSMAIMFISGTLLFLLLAVNATLKTMKGLLSLLFAFFMAIGAAATKYPGFSVIPMVIAVATYLLVLKPSLERESKGLFALLPLALGSLGLFLFVKIADPFGLYTLAEYRIFPHLIPHFTSGLGIGTDSAKNALIYFISFWLSFGWMVYKMSLGSYMVIAAISLMVANGLYVNRQKGRVPMRKGPFWVLQGYGITILLYLFFAEGDPQGRFFYMASSWLAVLFALGVSGGVPEKYSSMLANISASHLLLFNAMAIMGILIPVFYLK